MTPASPTSLLQLERQGAIAILRLNDAKRLNPLSTPLQQELLAALQTLASDTSVRCLVLTGEGRGFCVGADLSGMQAPEGQSLGAHTGHVMRTQSNPVIELLQSMPFPVLTSVNGPSAGAGVGLALAGDICVAAESAYFVLTFMPRLGIVPDLGITWWLERLLGRARAMGMALLGERLSAADAKHMGLIWDCVPDAQLAEHTLALAARLAALPKHAALELRAAYAHAAKQDLPAQLAYEAQRQQDLIDRPEFSEGVAAFLEKREPRF
ncbi:enoyl-CoA hydratase [Lampropedia aestuarii]|uniref:Enoyl-CoA hydratase n=1 Tax=Lampropedia aestuarii TaxID=2562762 RepID=A0A4S5BIB2_9BURK|nr:enoyl-CoA hydratase-related protein [Lampropedia aestuarii]MDH5859045.1 enoyl-CoA hydratase-related protein [Lampropedia aestuarii]THJ32154.1 enoyl-CoA hydratase [Lampropedia aestuarii]